MSVSTERLAFLALHFVPGVGNFLVKQLISYCGSAEAVFQSPKGKLLKIPNVGEVTAQSIKTGAPLREAEEEFGKAQKEGAEILFYTDDKSKTHLPSSTGKGRPTSIMPKSWRWWAPARQRLMERR
jgi:DNA processing protein